MPAAVVTMVGSLVGPGLQLRWMMEDTSLAKAWAVGPQEIGVTRRSSRTMVPTERFSLLSCDSRIQQQSCPLFRSPCGDV